jgi:predicted O-methyltransferase YrrM
MPSTIDRVLGMGCDSLGMFAPEFVEIGFDGGYLLQQHPREYSAFIDFLLAEKTPIKKVMEIGSAAGGNIAALNDFLGLDVPVILDINWHHHLPRRCEILAKVMPRLEIIGDSHDPKTKSLVYDLIPEGSLDLLFIDGDHSYAGVKQDSIDYTPLVKKGGLVGYHDTLMIEETGRAVNDFVAENSDMFEIVFESHVRIGITVLRVNV